MEKKKQLFFFKNLASSVTRSHGQLSCTISEKTNDLILRKISDGLLDGQTDGQTHKSDFIGDHPTNVKCPILNTFSLRKNLIKIPTFSLQWFKINKMSK